MKIFIIALMEIPIESALNFDGNKFRAAAAIIEPPHERPHKPKHEKARVNFSASSWPHHDFIVGEKTLTEAPPRCWVR